jgi:hypothetical protein
MSTQAEALPDLLDSNTAAGQKAARTRWWFVATVVVIAPLVLVVTGILAVVLWIMGMHGAALRKVEGEVARIQAAGEPITIDELYAQSRVPPGTRDITPLWLAALNSLDEQKFNADAKPLPIVGEVLGNDLPAADVAAAEQLLGKWDVTVQATLAASRAEGECRIPVEFNDGFSALLPNVQKLRGLSRMMLLRSRVAMAKGDTEQAVESVEAIFGASRALSHQMLLVEHLVRLATAQVALREVERLLNEAELSEKQLARLKGHVEALDFQAGQVRSLHGERGMGYHIFRHPEQMDMTKGDFVNKANPGEGGITRAADCLVYLELQKELIAAAGEAYPDALARADRVEMRLKSLAGSKNPLERYNHMFTLLIMPAMNATLQATARNLAHRDLVLCALSARQYQHARGELPASLAGLVPQYLPAVPTDPFDGQPLRFVAKPDGVALYSIGRDLKDDGGVDPEQTGEPDVVVRLKTKPEPGP